MRTPTPPAAPLSSFALMLAVAAGATARCQEPKQQPAKPAEAVGADLRGLPTFLLPVPAGRVTMGMTVEQLLQVVYEAINPARPELAQREPGAVRKKLPNVLSELGQQQVDVPAFLLGKWPVTNVEYEAFITKMKKLGGKEKAPFHWWRYGRKDDYDQKLEDINKQFPSDGKYGPIRYWERHGENLPYALKDDQGKGIEDQPVVFVSYRDAMRFAGWLGMRLPTEAEWTRAARGDGNHVWPWGANKELGDKFSEAILDKLNLHKGRDRKLKPVGEVTFATGPFGHFDMTGQVWEYISGLGFAPINGHKAFEEEWKRLQKDKIAEDLTPPLWRDDHVIVKGGSYFSSGDPVQFHIDCRTNLDIANPLDSVGFRLAKSLKPGYDQLFSLVHTDYNRDQFAVGQEPDLDNQIGVERYVLDAKGFPDEYHAVSFAPVNWLSDDKSVQVAKLEDRSQVRPVLLGTLSTTEPMLQPALAAGIYSVCYRNKGMPKELSSAIKAGFKVVQADLKRKDKDKGEAKPAEEPGKDENKDKEDWQTVLARFGLTPKDLEPKDALEKLRLIRIDGVEVPTETNAFLFYGNDARMVGVLTTSASLDNGALSASELTFEGRNERAFVELRIRTALQSGQKRGVEFKLPLVLDQGPPKPEQNWRLPPSAHAPAAAPTGSNKERGK